MDIDNNIRISFAKEIEGYLNNKRCLYEAEGRREYLPLVDQALNSIKSMGNVATTELSNQQSSCSSNPTFDRPSEKMYHYAEGEAIDCVICIEQVEANHAQVRLSCGHIYHLNCLGSHFNHSGDYKCPYCRVEVDKYAKQPRIWEHPVNGPPQAPSQIDANDMPHPGELDFANFQRGVLQVVNSIFGGRLNLGHPFRNDNGTEDYYDNDDDSQSENEDTIYDTRYVGSNDSESSDDSDDSEDEREYDRSSNIGFRSQRNSYYSSSNDTMSSSARRNSPRLSMGNGHQQIFHDNYDEDTQENLSSLLQDSTIRSRPMSRNRPPRTDSMSGSAFRRFDNSNELHSSFIEHATQTLYERNPNHFEHSRFERSRPPSFAADTTPRSEVSEMSRYRHDDYYPRSDFIDMPRFRSQDIFSNNENSIYNNPLSNNSSTSSLATNNQHNEQIYNNANNGHHFSNTLPQTIINASQQSASSNYHNSSLYRTPSDSEFEFSNALYRHASTSSRLRNMYQDDSTTDDLMDGESDSSSSSSSVDSDDDDQDEDEAMLYNWDASNDMETSDDSESEDEVYRRRSAFTPVSSVSSVSSSSEDEDNDNDDNDNESVVTTSTNNTRSEHWYKPSWLWSRRQDVSNSTVPTADSDATISSGDDCE